MIMINRSVTLQINESPAVLEAIDRAQAPIVPALGGQALVIKPATKNEIHLRFIRFAKYSKDLLYTINDSTTPSAGTSDKLPLNGPRLFSSGMLAACECLEAGFTTSCQACDNAQSPCLWGK